jgi:hypothetical protein
MFFSYLASSTVVSGWIQTCVARCSSPNYLEHLRVAAELILNSNIDSFASCKSYFDRILASGFPLPDEFFESLTKQEKPEVRALMVAIVLRQHLLNQEHLNIDDLLLMKEFIVEFPRVASSMHVVEDDSERMFLTRFIFTIRELLKFIDGKGKQHLFVTVASFIEDSNNVYIQGGAATNATKNRLLIFQTLSGVVPTKHVRKPKADTKSSPFESTTTNSKIRKKRKNYLYDGISSEEVAAESRNTSPRIMVPTNANNSSSEESQRVPMLLGEIENEQIDSSYDPFMSDNNTCQEETMLFKDSSVGDTSLEAVDSEEFWLGPMIAANLGQILENGKDRAAIRYIGVSNNERSLPYHNPTADDEHNCSVLQSSATHREVTRRRYVNPAGSSLPIDKARQ